MIAGYELAEVLGRGAHGYVVRGVQRSLGRVVAVKRLNPGAATDAIRREAAALMAIGHPHVIPILDVVADGDGVALVLPLAAGGSMADRLAREGSIATSEVVSVAVKLSGALAASHRLGVLHLDVKPSNVLLTADGEPWLADFGVARWVGETSAAAGSAGFIAPEVLAGAPDVRSDVFSLARLCLTLLASPAPSELHAMLERASDPDPARRPASAVALGEELRRFAVVGTAPAPAVVTTHGGAPEPTRTFGPRPPAPEPTRSIRPGRRATKVAVVVASVAALVWSLRGTAQHDSAVAPRAGACRKASTAPRDAYRLTGLLGDGLCPTDVLWWPSQAEAEVRGEGDRFRLGQPGDTLLLGDWDCNGRDTPALYRGSSGEVFRFDAWATDDAKLPSAASATDEPRSFAWVVSDADGCDHVIVSDVSEEEP